MSAGVRAATVAGAALAAGNDDVGRDAGAERRAIGRGTGRIDGDARAGLAGALQRGLVRRAVEDTGDGTVSARQS